MNILDRHLLPPLHIRRLFKHLSRLQVDV